MVKFDELFGEAQEGFKPDKKKRVGGYILGKTLGEGSFAKVRLATHVLTNEKVAVKVINKKLIIKREYVRKNMRREAVMLQRIEHPHIVRLYEVMETENSFYMVTELAEGGDFMKYLTDRQYLSESETRRYMRQIVSAVDHMHRSGVVHRDLKIENLLLDRDMNIKIIDFGLSNHWDGQSLLSTQCGSPAYAAPEIFSKKQYGPAVDVWSIGINMFAMLTGRLPFLVDPPTNLTKLHALILKGCTVPDNLTKSCQDLLSRLLDPSVSHRISMKDLMTHNWLNEEYVPLQAWGLKVRMRQDDIQQDAVDFMVDHLNIAEIEIRDSVINCKPNSTTGTYHLLHQRLLKGMPLPDENAMGQGQRKDVVDEMKRHHQGHGKVNGTTEKEGRETPQMAFVANEAGHTPRFPAISHREVSQRRRSKPTTNAPLTSKKRSNSHEVLSSLQQSLNVVKIEGDTKDNMILQDLEHIIKDLGGEEGSNNTTPRNGYKECLKILNNTSGSTRKSRPPKVSNRGILKREKASSLPESLNHVEPRNLYSQQIEMESPGSNRSVHFQPSSTYRKLSRQGSDVSSVISDKYTSNDRRHVGPHTYHYNARLQAELEALTRLEPIDSQHRASSLQSLPGRSSSITSADRKSLRTPSNQTPLPGPIGIIKREYSSVQDVCSDSLSHMRSRQSPLDGTGSRNDDRYGRLSSQRLERERTIVTASGDETDTQSSVSDLRPHGSVRRVSHLDRHRSDRDISTRPRSVKRHDSKESVRSSDYSSSKHIGALYTMPDYTDPMQSKSRTRRYAEPSASRIPVKWRDPSRHSLRKHSSDVTTPRHKDIYNEYITQKQSLHYHHTTMPSVLQIQK